MFTSNSTKLNSVPIIAYNSNVHFARNVPFSQTRSHILTSGPRVQFSHPLDTLQLVVWSVFLGTKLYFCQDMYFRQDHSQDVQLLSLPPYALLIGVNGKFCNFVAANV